MEQVSGVVSGPGGFELYQFPFAEVPYKGLLFWCGEGGHLLGFDPYNNSRFCHSVEIEGPVELTIISYIHSKKYYLLF